MKTNQNQSRLIKHCQELGFKNDVYVELLMHIESLPQLHYFTGNDFYNAETLARWGFVQKISSPIVKDGQMIGRNVLYAPIGLELTAKLQDELVP